MRAPTFQSSGDLIADRRFEWARAAQERGDLAGAADLLAQVVELAPGYAPAWFALGELCGRLRDRDGAVAAFEKARGADPADRHGATLQLARLGVADGEMPPAYVRAVFDQYAPGFDKALVEGLSYRAPQLLLDAVKRTGVKIKFGSVLDLGCGTGLAGAAFRPLADRLVGVDLSSGMIAQARGKGLYDRLVEADVLQFLNGEAAVAARYHLILAADVFMYLLDLASVMAAAARVLAPGGIFAFTVETHDGGDVLLRDTLRYAHGEAHVRGALVSAGLGVSSLDSASTRSEKDEAVPGLVVLAQAPSS
ncbi:MAG: methyltransferase [Pseudolabrys sp.]